MAVISRGRDGMPCPGIDSDGSRHVDLKAVAGVVPVIDSENSEPAPCAMIDSPIHKNLGFALFNLPIVAFRVVAHAVSGLFRKCIARPSLTHVAGPRVPEHAEVVDRKAR